LSAHRHAGSASANRNKRGRAKNSDDELDVEGKSFICLLKTLLED
jgi:hypothetical protein